MYKIIEETELTEIEYPLSMIISTRGARSWGPGRDFREYKKNTASPRGTPHKCRYFATM